GLDYKQEWRYALKLWGALYLLESDRIAGTYDYLLKHAASSQFKNSLASVREMYDSNPLAEQ
ncbi:MAG TPA: hypothetical protein VFT02_04455, partial [Pyrinomonadaceae bacterium]|nr:hypothetical protein [Pyrinomonadaceae bacterium]